MALPSINDNEVDLLKKIVENTANGGGGGGGAVSSVNGQTGVVVLGKADVGLSAANNTSDVNKPVSTAQAAADAAVAAAASSDATTKANAAQAASQPLDSDLTAISALATTAFGRNLLTETNAASIRSTIGAGTSSFDGVFASLTSKPTTLAGYGISDGITSAAVAAGYQPLDSDLTAIAALTTTAFGRGLLTETNAASIRATIGAGTSSFDGVFASLTSKPTTLAGYGISDGITSAAVAAGYQPLDADLTAIAALTTTTYGRSLLTGADAAATRTSLSAAKALSIVNISSNTTVDSTYNEALVRCTANLTLQLDNVAANTRIYVTSEGDNLITFSAGSGMSITGNTTIGGNGAVATLIQVSASVWEVYAQSPSATLNTGLFAFYPLDESASATTRRDIVGGETLTATAASGSAAGKTRLRALLMGAVANQAMLTTTTAGDVKFDRGAGALTVSAWIKATALTNTASIATMWTTTGNKRVFLLEVNTSGKAQFLISPAGTSSGNFLATSTATLVTGTWYFVVGYYNPTTGKVGIVVNAGTPDETTAGSGMFVTTGQALQIGAQEASATVSAAIQDVGFWSRNLTTSEIARLYNSGSGLTYPFFP